MRKIQTFAHRCVASNALLAQKKGILLKDSIVGFIGPTHAGAGYGRGLLRALAAALPLFSLPPLACAPTLLARNCSGKKMRGCGITAARMGFRGLQRQRGVGCLGRCRGLSPSVVLAVPLPCPPRGGGLSLGLLSGHSGPHPAKRPSVCSSGPGPLGRSAAAVFSSPWGAGAAGATGENGPRTLAPLRSRRAACWRAFGARGEQKQSTGSPPFPPLV